jgi:hypothetical protein
VTRIATIQPGQAPPPANHRAAEVNHAFETHTYGLLRKRFKAFTALLAVLNGLLLLTGLVFWLFFKNTPWWLLVARPSGKNWASFTLSFGLGVITTSIYALCYYIARTTPLPKERLLNLTYLLVVCDGLIKVLASYMPGLSTLGIFGVMVTHVLACGFLPWKPVQAMKPLIPVLGVWAIIKLATGWGDLPETGLKIALAPIVGVPGVLLCMAHSSQRMQDFERAFFARRYNAVQRELYDARRIHESLFPAHVADGTVTMRYAYEPMQLIGGDYLFTFRPPADNGRDDGPLSVVLLDVTGHGITAALTVNRLNGELHRIYGEDPEASPHKVLKLLNRYAHLTLSRHSVYLTALVMRADPDVNTLEFASAGHPPAYIRRADGGVEELRATTFVLGACPDDDFDPMATRHPFHPGDVVIAYTDGVLEAKGIDGRMLGLAGVRAFLEERRESPGCNDLLNLVLEHRHGPSEDDVLVVELSRAGAAENRGQAGHLAAPVGAG